jgi:hypothetical protein
VTDFPGETGTASVQIQVSNQPPVPVIDTPSSSLTWHVGETVSFSGHATDPNQGNLPASGLRWQLLLHHCENDGSCHVHPIQAYNGVSSGNFAAPDHPYPSHLELILTATDQFGAQTSTSIELQPETVDIDFRTVPGGLKLSIGGEQVTAPATETFIHGSLVSIGANSPQPSGGPAPWNFSSWSDGGARSHDIVADGSTDAYTASFSQVLGASEGASVGVVDVTTGLWYLRDAASGSTTRFYYGNPGDVPMVGDWDCDGDETPGLYRQSDGFVYLRNSNTQGVANLKFFFGNPGDIPVAGDFDGDGCDTVSIYRPSEGRVYVMNHLGNGNQGLGAADFEYYFGNPGDKPFAGDFDNDGIDEIGLHRESTGLVYFRYTHTQGVADKSFIFGNPGDRIIAGRWAQIGVPGADTVGLFRPSNGNFYLRFSNSAGNADLSFKYGNSKMWPVAGIFGPLPGGGAAPPG